MLTPRHVNNVNYVRYVETARINWTETLREELPERTVMSMLVRVAPPFPPSLVFIMLW